jgi:RNA polymerase sigma factor (sigma-70 family)
MSNEAISDEILMQRFQETLDEEAFGEIVARYYRPALVIARSLAGSGAVVEDAVQEAFVKTVRNRGKYDPRRSFCPWFYTILRNVCADIRRKEVRHADQLRELAECDRPAAEPSDLSDNFMEMIRLLDPTDREILIYRFVHGMTFQEIAKQTGLSVEAAKKRAQRALKQLRT